MPATDSSRLQELPDGKAMEISSFLYSAAALTKLVQSAHRQNKIIGRLSPACVRFRQNFREAVLIEEGRPDYAYLSPEQLGRINHRPDERSDLYALGILFYRMLAGVLPFQGKSLEDWIHLHMATLPRPLSELRPELAGPLNEMVAKLLSKSPDERYQSAYGVLADLQLCMGALETEGVLLSFEIGMADRASRFRLPATLFGREQEERELRMAFEQACAGSSELILVTGPTGSGKTALIGNLQIPVIREGGRFITGKCDLMNREIPFSPILQALRKLLQQIWSESPDQVAKLRMQLLEALGQGAGVITEFLPEAAKLLGATPAVEQLPPAESAVRFRRLLPLFIQSFAGREQPLVLFLDDLQWADPDTLDVLRVLTDDAAMQGLVVIGAFRSETEQEQLESGDEHSAAALWLDQMISRKSSDLPLRVLHIALIPLSYVDVRQFISHILEENSARVRQLAELLYHRTGGDPLYLHRLLDSLYREQKLYFDEQQAVWNWDMAAITELPEAPGLLHLIESRLHLLPGDSIGLLGIAAALGHRFRVSAIASMSGYPMEETLDLLHSAELEGLIIREDDAAQEESEDLIYAFLHDRVQQAAYEIVPIREQASLHLEIGRAMCRNKEEYSIFDRVYHLNLGSVKMEDKAERTALAELNLQAGLKSKATTAFAAALHFLETGLHLIGEDEGVPGSLAYKLMLELPECEYMCGYTERAAAQLEKLMSLTGDLLERSRIYRIRIGMYTFLKKDDLAVQVGRQGLAEFGWKLPVKSSQAAILKEVAMTQSALYRMRDQLPQLPLSHDPHYNALSDLMMAIATSIFTLSLELSAVLFARFVRYGLKRGNNEAFVYILAGYGLVILRNKMSFSQLGASYIEKAFLLSSTFDNADLQCRLSYIRGLARLQQNPEEGVEYFRQAVRYGMESSNLPFVSIAMLTSTINHPGNVHRLSAMVKEYEATAQKLVDEVTLNIFRIAKGHVAHLQGQVDESGKAVVPVESSRSKERLNNEVYYNCICQTEIAYLEGRFREALEWVEQGKFNTFRQTRMQVRKQHIYQSLTLASLYDEVPQEEGKSIHKKLKKLLHLMKHWTGYFGQGTSACLLLTAENQRIEGDRTGAAKSYEGAIETARQEGYGLMEAIACERASLFYRKAGSVTGADGLLTDACLAYSLWGAVVKVNKLQKEYPTLRLAPAEETKGNKGVQQAGGFTADEAFVDDGKELLRHIFSWTDSADRQDRITVFLDSALRYSGAVTGYVLSSNGDGFYIEAHSGGMENQSEAQSLAESVVRYVLRTGEPLMLADAANSSYAADPYILANRSLSILCMPVLFPGEVTPSVLYLENNLIGGAFTQDGLEVLDFLITRMVYLQSLQDSRSEMIPMGDMVVIPLESSELPLGPCIDNSIHPLTDSLTLREKEILYSLSDGLSNKEIAERFGITEGTVKSHVFRLYGKLGVKRRAQAITRARELQLLD